MGLPKGRVYDRSFKLAALERLAAGESVSGVARALYPARAVVRVAQGLSSGWGGGVARARPTFSGGEGRPGTTVGRAAARLAAAGRAGSGAAADRGPGAEDRSAGAGAGFFRGSPKA